MVSASEKPRTEPATKYRLLTTASQHTSAVVQNGAQDGPDYESLYRAAVADAARAAGEAGAVQARLEEEVREARDQAELLEFRLLELQERESRERSPGPASSTVTADSGTGSVAGSVASLEDLLDTQPDFRNQKIGDTKVGCKL